MIKKISYTLLLLLLFNQKTHAKSAQEAENFIENIGNELILFGSNAEKDLEETRQDMIEILKPAIDFNFISKFLMKNYYHQLRVKKKKLLKLAIDDFVVTSYSKKFNGYKGEEFKVNSTKGKNPYYEVSVIINAKEIKNINISFRLRYDKNINKFKVFDLIIEGISILQAQKKAFESRIDVIGIDEFILELEEKTLEMQGL
jgi:phospholipid transport system substrate-binding protein